MIFNVGEKIYKFELLKKLGKGNFGEVWLAKDNNIDKEVALKILPSDFSSIAKLLEEAINGNKVNHKNLLEIFSADVVNKDGTIITLIAQAYQKRGTIENNLNPHNFLPLPLLLKTLTDVLLGLEYLHNGGVIHNDIKPSNILLDEYDNSILSDYGISSFSKDMTPVSPKNVYRIHGAPETISGAHKISIRTDIYQLGCTAYRLANGISSIKNDFLKDQLNFDAAKLKGKIPSRKHKPYVPKKLAAIINKAIQVDPNKRYTSAIDMKHALEQLNLPGYWTTNPLKTSELIGYGKNYTYSYEIIPKPSNLFDMNAYQTNKNGRKTRKTVFCKKNLSLKEKDRLLKEYFEWVFNNAK